MVLFVRVLPQILFTPSWIFKTLWRTNLGVLKIHPSIPGSGRTPMWTTRHYNASVETTNCLWGSRDEEQNTTNVHENIFKYTGNFFYR